MGRATVIREDGKSPLSNYVNLLVAVPDNLARLLDRDAQALRILMADPALPVATLARLFQAGNAASAGQTEAPHSRSGFG